MAKNGAVRASGEEAPEIRSSLGCGRQRRKGGIELVRQGESQNMGAAEARLVGRAGELCQMGADRDLCRGVERLPIPEAQIDKGDKGLDVIRAGIGNDILQPLLGKERGAQGGIQP